MHEEVWEKRSGFIISIILFGILLALGFGTLRYLDWRSEKYFKEYGYSTDYDGPRRRTVNGSFELRALLVDELVRDRAVLWAHRMRIDLMIPPARDFFDKGTNPDRRHDELVNRDKFFHEAYQFLTGLGVAHGRVEEHFDKLRTAIREEEERLIRSYVTSLERSIARVAEELPKDRQRLAMLRTFSESVLVESR